MIRKTTAKTGRTQQRKLPELEVEDIDEEDGEGYSFVLYGRSGTGKTTVAASWPGPILYLDVSDRGAKSIRDVKGIKKRRIASFEDFEETYWWLKENPERYRTIIVDTVSQLQRIVVQEKTDAKGKKGRAAGDWGTLTQRDWGDISALLKEWITNYRDLVDLGMDVVFIAQDRTFNAGEDEDLDEQLAPEVGPGLSPATAKALNAAVDFIGNTFIRTRIVKAKPAPGKKVARGPDTEVIEYCMRVGPNSLYVTKVRKPKSIEAPAVIVDPDYDEIMAIIEGD